MAQMGRAELRNEDIYYLCFSDWGIFGDLCDIVLSLFSAQQWPSEDIDTSGLAGEQIRHSFSGNEKFHSYHRAHKDRFANNTLRLMIQVNEIVELRVEVFSDLRLNPLICSSECIWLCV